MLVIGLMSSNVLIAKDKKDKEEGYKFTPKIQLETCSVKDQGSSGTCWSYATSSFIEAELIRLGKGKHDISEMFFVRKAYPQKAIKYIRYQGLSNFSEGGQAHDVTNVIREFGMVPESVYRGLNYGFTYHKHGEMVSVLTGILDSSIKKKSNFTGKSLDVFSAALDIYLGEVPEKFIYMGKEYTPKTFADSMNFNSDDYVEFTSYSCYPFNEKIDLEIPDNWSRDLYYNIELNDLMGIINYAFENGYSVNWDGDVSESGFSHKNGVAVVPEDDPKEMEDSERLKWESLSEKEQKEMLFDFSKPRKEKNVTQEVRQEAFDKFKTTDDHLMHLTGTGVDQNGTLYYHTKNSWAEDSNKFGGSLYMSEAFIKLKTVAIQVHKDAIPQELKDKLGIK
ncbi:MAG: aminopeptidase [Salinivirgaceae bacterium]|nr:aminopeptidase [Salinivirgaceae bacterium]